MHRLRLIAAMALISIITSSAVAVPQGWVMAPDDPNSDFQLFYDPDETNLFGDPRLVNNTILFFPSAFAAQSTSQDGVLVFLSSSVVLELVAKETSPAFAFDEFFLREGGDYQLQGPTAAVTVSGQIRATALDIDPFTNYSDNIVATAPFDNRTDPNVNWTAEALLDAASGWVAGSRNVILTVENMLSAITYPGDLLAFIEKKNVGIRIGVNMEPVPLPAAVWLLGTALFGLLGYNVRRKD